MASKDGAFIHAACEVLRGTANKDTLRRLQNTLLKDTMCQNTLREGAQGHAVLAQERVMKFKDTHIYEAKVRLAGTQVCVKFLRV